MRKLVHFLVVTLAVCDLSAQSEKPAWDYPTKPGMEEWNRPKTEQERINVLQVPESVLEKLSPDEVVQLCITFPSFGHFFYYNTPQKGFEVMLSRYNIFKHLLSRKDVGRYLIDAYKDASLSGFKTLPYSNEFWTIKFHYLELLISQKEILQSLTSEEKLDLISEARLKYAEKINNEGFASIPTFLFSIRLMTRILDMEKYLDSSLSSNKHFNTALINEGWSDVEMEPIEEVVRITDNFINSKKK